MAAIISQEYNLETRLRKIKRLKGYFTYTVQLKHEHIGTQQQIQMMIYAVVMQPFFFFFLPVAFMSLLTYSPQLL